VIVAYIHIDLVIYNHVLKCGQTAPAPLSLTLSDTIRLNAVQSIRPTCRAVVHLLTFNLTVLPRRYLISIIMLVAIPILVPIDFRLDRLMAS
jgi:hypothetical protein